MSSTGSGRKAAVLCAAVVLLGSMALPAAATPGLMPALPAPAEPAIPSAEDIARAKASEAATADQVSAIERILEGAASAQQAAFAVALQANNAYSAALV